MASSLRKRVRERAGNRCEYCRISQEDVPLFPFHVEHIMPASISAPTERTIAYVSGCAIWPKRYKVSSYDASTGRSKHLTPPHFTT
jgi:hypothetical protein